MLPQWTQMQKHQRPRALAIRRRAAKTRLQQIRQLTRRVSKTSKRQVTKKQRLYL